MRIINSNKKAEIEIILLRNKALPKDLSKSEKDLLALFNYKGEGGVFLAESKKYFVGIESCGYDFPNTLRDAFCSAIKALKKLNIKTVSFQVDDPKEAREICEGVLLGMYSFDTYKKDQSKTSPQTTLQALHLSSLSLPKAQLDAIIKEASILANSIDHARELINTPPMQAVPIYVADVASNMAKEHGIDCKIYDESFLAEQKMQAFLAVAQASVNPPRLVHLSYKPKKTKKSLPKFVFVGKGLTYDTGGLSLKPGDYMTTMKADKSGACAVIGILESVAQLGIEAEVHGILGLAENMIGGNAYKPDDILQARNQKTIEVRNTDAEGRLVLADCLSYACDLNPDYLVDLATLTGACVVGLGDYTIGLMGYNQKLKEHFAQVAFDAGELTGNLPFNPYMKKLYQSEIAHLCNIPSSRYGGAIAAGMFLGEFVEDELKDKWLHLDIAGPAYVEKAWGVNPFGASGAGIRACVEFVKSKA